MRIDRIRLRYILLIFFVGSLFCWLSSYELTLLERDIATTEWFKNNVASDITEDY